MARSNRSRVEAVLRYLWQGELRATDQWEREDLRLAWNTVHCAFYESNPRPFDTAFKRKYGKSFDAEMRRRAALDEALFKPTIPLIPWAKDSRQLTLPFGPYVIQRDERTTITQSAKESVESNAASLPSPNPTSKKARRASYRREGVA